MTAPDDPEKGPEPGFADRETLGHWASKQAEKNQIHSYQKDWNSKSLDGLNGLRSARRDLNQKLWLEDVKAGFARMMSNREALLTGFFLGLAIALLVSYGQAILPTFV